MDEFDRGVISVDKKADMVSTLSLWVIRADENMITYIFNKHAR